MRQTKVRGSLAKEDDPNFTKLQQYGDLDALIQLYGHLRAENPTLDVLYKLASEVVPDDYGSHVILLGGIGWNKATRHIESVLGQVPIGQIDRYRPAGRRRSSGLRMRTARSPFTIQNLKSWATGMNSWRM